MKKILYGILIAILLTGVSSASAQQVNTLYFLENAPMRHTINPAFQPVSKFYLTLPIIGYTSLWTGTNGWTMSDFLFKGPNGQTITPFHPDAPINWLDKQPNTFAIDADANFNILGFGFRIKKNSYLHINISEHITLGGHVSSSIFKLNDLSSGNIAPISMGGNAMAYTDFALGFSHNINRKWTVGGKIKVLVGQAHMGLKVNDLKFATSLDSLHAMGNGSLQLAAPLNFSTLPNDPSQLGDYDVSELYENLNGLANLNSTNINDIYNAAKEILKPAGMGVAFDLGFTYKPIKQLQLSASVTDLGFIRWHNYASTKFSIDTTFTGVDLEYGDYGDLNGFDTDALMNDLSEHMAGYSDGIRIDDIEKGFPYINMLTANLNVGIDANFWDNRVGVGVYSRTRFYNSQVTEELTFGAAFRPVNWFNLAASYSFINGNWSNIGAALSLAPYDGIMLTLATDYIPMSYAKATMEETNISLPYKTSGVNVSFGIAIVAGTNNKTRDKDKDGVWDKIDVCPNTPLNVMVDEMGCPIDSDADGVPDYMDKCPHTQSAAYGFIDSVGCPIDTDGDGIHDYVDQCPNTPAEARAYVNSLGCVEDSDKDGVYDYMDKCPNTPIAAQGLVDSVGCPIDTDGDGVYDYLDLCPETKEEAYGMIDQNGCPLDTDKDGIYDYMDKCPNTPADARNYVDSVGCMLDSDGDGVYDYEDVCPTIAGIKENLGCPEIKKEVRNLLKKAMSGIEFEFNKATIKPNSYEILDQVAQVFIENPIFIVEVQGHTDNVGNDEYNLDLSERRAQAVRTYLVNKGVPAERLTAKGYGPHKPITTNDTAEGRAINRRVEFSIAFEEVSYEIIYERVQQK